jgi:hypothetical protein
MASNHETGYPEHIYTSEQYHLPNRKHLYRTYDTSVDSTTSINLLLYLYPQCLVRDNPLAHSH